jgi:DNA-binding response OmpR family regulator
VVVEGAGRGGRRSAPPAHILVVEDDEDIWNSLEVLFRRAGYVAQWAADGGEGLRRFGSDRPDLVVLDVSLPGIDGWTVLERLRHVSRVPVMLLTARTLEVDKVRGLQSGADDYLTKPFSNDELVARVAALLRRSPPLPSDAKADVFDDGRVRVDFANHAVEADGRPVDLTPTELRLLAALVRHAEQVLSPEQLLELGWDDSSGSGLGRVKFTVLSLRRKMGWTDVRSCPVENVRGVGYRYRHAADPA